MEKKSRVTDYTEYCLFDEQPATEFHHLIFGNGRSRSEQDGLVIPVCRKCHTMSPKVGERIHDNPRAEDFSKMFGQAIWERNYCAEGHTVEEARAAFCARYKRMYY